MSAPDYLFGSARDLAALIARGAYSSVEIVEQHLARIERVNVDLNAVVTVATKRAMREAEQADRDLAGHAQVGPQHGVPITIKDSFDTAGVLSTAGTQGRRHHIPMHDASVVARLRAAGAVVVGKTNTPELTMGEDTSNPIFGRTSNPYDPAYSPSGSSGGAGAILAAGGSALDVGSDTGGSIREPAHVCGVVGLKPTAGRLPKTGHAIPFGIGLIDSITQVGPMARFVEDVELALGLMNGPDGFDFTVAPVALRRADDVDIATLRIGFFTDNGLWQVQSTVADVVEKTVAALEPRVLSSKRVEPTPIQRMGDLYSRFRTADGGWGLRRLLEVVGTTEPSDALARRIAASSLVDTEALAKTVLEVDRFKADMLRFMADFDALVCPACPYEPWQHGSGLNARYQEWSYCVPFNLTGWPCLVLRAGSTSKKLPLGVQIVAPPWREDIVIALGKIVEREAGGYQKPDY